jgi:type IV secretory pathway TrbF-like protein
MAVQENRSGGSGNGFLYFAVGALIVAVAVLGYMFYQGQQQTPTESAIESMADSVGEAADSVGDAARDAANNPPAPN